MNETRIRNRNKKSIHYEALSIDFEKPSFIQITIHVHEMYICVYIYINIAAQVTSTILMLVANIFTCMSVNKIDLAKPA